jgi:8-oxo-dGTP diphosphatase
MARIVVAVGAVIVDDKDRVLLVKHVPERNGFWQGKWICPGGTLELGESIVEGIIREVKEETNLDIELTTLLPPFERIVKSDSKTTLHVIYIDSLARLVRGEFQPGSDVGEGIWVSREELPEIWDELHRDTQKLLEIANVIRSKAVEGASIGPLPLIT